MQEFFSAARKAAGCAVVLGAALLAGTHYAQAQDQTQNQDQQQPAALAAPGTAPMAPKAAPMTVYNGPKYDNHWELYGGLLYMNGRAGQDIRTFYSMGGAEGMATYWLGNGPKRKWGLAGDYRFGAGTSPTLPIGNNYKYNFNRVLVMQHVFSGGAVYRGPSGRYAGIDFHALAGADYGVFDHAIRNYPDQSALTIAACPAQEDATHPVSLGLYCNHVSPWGAVGGSVDFNESAKLAVRLQPDVTFEHFGDNTRYFFSISMGVLYRFGGTAKMKAAAAPSY